MPNIAQILGRFPYFGEAELPAGSPLLTGIALQIFAPHAIIFAEDAAADTLFLIKRGEVRIARQLDGLEKPLGFLRAGDLFGEMGLLRGTPRMATATALVETAALAIPKATAIALAENFPAFHAKLAHTYTTHYHVEQRDNRHHTGQSELSLYRGRAEDRSDED